MAEKIEFDLSVKGGTTNNQLNQSLVVAEKSAVSLEGALSVAVGVFGGNLLTKGLDLLKNQLGKAVDESIAFKRAQLEIETILPKNEKLTANLVRQLENLSAQYGTTPTAQAKAYYEIISAGVSSAADGAKLLARANELATGGVADTASTIDLLTTIYNVYGKELATTTEASDSLFKTVQIGKTTIQELSSDLGQALPIAKSFGIGLDEVGSILAQLTNSGISTSESVTLLNAVLAAIARNGAQLGEGFNSAAVQTEGLGVVLERLRERTNGSNDALFKLLGRQEAVRAVQSLTAKGLENYNSVLAEYTNKAGVAADASKKILEGDVGKQFTILAANVSNYARSIIDLFVPATLSAIKAVNDFNSTEISSENVEKGLERTRRQIERLTKEFDNGRITADDYERSLRQAQNTLATFSNQAATAQSPLVLLTSGLEKDAERIKAQIGSIKNGFDELNLGPIERSLKLSELNAQLDSTVSKIKELKSVSSGVSNVAVEAPAARSDIAIEAEKKLQADLTALRLQFAADSVTFEDQLALVEKEKLGVSNEEATLQIYNQKAREAEAVYQGELVKNALVLDAKNQALLNEKAFETKQEALIKARNNKRLADDKAASAARLALEQQTLNTRLGYISAFGNLAAAVAKDGSKTQFLIQQSAAIAGSIVATQLAAAQALAVPPAPNLALAATAKTIGAINTAAIVATSLKGFAGGGIVGGDFNGAAGGKDNVTITARQDEMMLNGAQQKTLFDAISSGSLGGGGDIVIKIDEREIFRAVRNQLNGGAKFA